MIIQGLLDFVSVWVSGILNGMPALPAAFYDSINSVSSSMTSLGGILSILGPALPFYEINLIAQWFLAWLLFWALMAALRLVLWLVGR